MEIRSLDKLMEKTKLLYPIFELYLFKIAGIFSEDYDGGYWESCFVEEDEEELFYAILEDDKEYRIRNTQNFYNSGDMDSKTFSLSIWCYTLNIFAFHLLEKGDEERSNLFFDLYRYARRNAGAILQDEEKAAQLHWFLD